MWEMVGNILLYNMSYDTVSPSNSLSYDTLFEAELLCVYVCRKETR